MGKEWQEKEWNLHRGCSPEMQEAQVECMLCLSRPIQVLEYVLTSFMGISPKPLKSIAVFWKLLPKRVGPRNLLGVVDIHDLLEMGNKYIFHLQGEEKSCKLQKSKWSTAFVTVWALI